MPTKSTQSLSQVAANLQAEPEQSLIFECFLSAAEIKQACHDHGHRFRDRISNPVVTLWMFLGQTLSPDHSCRDAVARFNAWRVEHSKPKADANTTAYCEARKRIPEPVFAGSEKDPRHLFRSLNRGRLHRGAVTVGISAEMLPGL